jgi:hypothetical protein
LVFGPERQQRVWMVLDGATLYVDLNGNGDLTEPDERLEPIHPKDGIYRTVNPGSHEVMEVRLADPGALQIFEFTVRAGATATSKFQLHLWTYASWLTSRWSYGLLLRQEGRGQGQTPLVFMPKPADAHVCALDGPLTFVVRMPQHQVLRRGEDGCDLAFQIAVMGRSPRGDDPFFERAFFNPLGTKEVPQGAYLDVEIEYPGNRPHAPPLHRRYLLKQRC